MLLKLWEKTAKKLFKEFTIGHRTQFNPSDKTTLEINKLTQYPIQWVEK
jgi:hypothetical protein